MAGIRSAVGVLAVAVVLTPAAAWACEQPEQPEKRERVAGKAGETVEIAIPNTLEGARWEIRREGAEDDAEPLAKGEDEDAEPGVEAELEVPDLGEAERELTLVVEVTHAGDASEWSYELVLVYRGRPAPDEPKEPETKDEADSAPAPAPAPPAPPAPQPDRAARSEPAPAPAAAPASAPPPPAPPPAPAASAPPAQAAPVPAPTILERAAPARRLAPLQPPSAAPPATTGGAAPGLTSFVEAVETSMPALTAGPAPAAGDRPDRRARDRGRSARPRTSFFGFGDGTPRRRHEPLDEGGIRLPDVAVPGFGAGLLWSVILGGALAFAVAGLGVGALARHRRRRPALR